MYVPARRNIERMRMDAPPPLHENVCILCSSERPDTQTLDGREHVATDPGARMAFGSEAWF